MFSESDRMFSDSKNEKRNADRKKASCADNTYNLILI